MSRRRPPALLASLCVSALLLACTVAASGANREECERQFKPAMGQPGKDVMWVPTNDALVARMLKMAQCYVQADRLGERVRIIHGDIFQIDFTAATVVTRYLLPELNLRLRPTILGMKPGTRVVSHSFLMADWEPDERSMTEDGNAYLWIVPAQVAGTWEFRQPDGQGRIVVKLEQSFQHLSGSAGDEPLISDARIRGSQIDLTFFENPAPTKVEGRVDGNRIDAQVTRGGKTSRYIGTRSQGGSGG